jgi:hypothetical protein
LIIKNPHIHKLYLNGEITLKQAMGMLMKHVLPQQKQIEQNTFDHPTNFQIEIIDRIDQVSDYNTLDKVIDLMANE